MLFTAIIVVATVYLLLYICLSIPGCQNFIKRKAVTEISTFLGSEVKIDALQIKPFNEVVVKDLEVFDPEGKRCLEVATLGAGINLLSLIREKKIELTYAEIIGLDARIEQPDSTSGLNIDFIINAFKPKDKNKPPVKFDLNLRNVVIRRSAVSFDRPWIPRDPNRMTTDFNHFRIRDLKADLNVPRLTDEEVNIDLRRLSFNLSGGMKVEKLAFESKLTSRSLSISNLILRLPATVIKTSDISLSFSGYDHLIEALETGSHSLSITDSRLSLADFSWLNSNLSQFPETLDLEMDVSGNMNNVDTCHFILSGKEPNDDILVTFMATAENIRDKEEFKIEADNLKIKIPGKYISRTFGSFKPDRKIEKILSNLGGLFFQGKGTIRPYKGDIDLDASLTTDCGNLSLKGNALSMRGPGRNIEGIISLDNVQLGSLLNYPDLEGVTGDIKVDASGFGGKNLYGTLSAVLKEIGFRGRKIDGIDVNLFNSTGDFGCEINIFDDAVSLNIDAEGQLKEDNFWCSLNSNIERLNPFAFGYLKKYPDYLFKGRINLNVEGKDVESLLGEVRLNDFSFESPDPEARGLNLDHLLIKSEVLDSAKKLSIKSELISGFISGKYKYRDLAVDLKTMLATVFPSFFSVAKEKNGVSSDMVFNFEIAADNTITDFFRVPLGLLVPATINGKLESSENRGEVHISAPFLRQGNNLVTNSIMDATLEGEDRTLTVDLSTIYPVKAHDVKFNLSLKGHEDNLLTGLSWLRPDDPTFKGDINFSTQFHKVDNSWGALVTIDPGVMDFGAARWTLDKAMITYSDKKAEVDGLKISHGDQLIEIGGMASESNLDSLKVDLANIDVGYIFDTLNSKNLSFGGIATGNLAATGLLSKQPVIYTDHLNVAGFSYNDAIMGDAVLKSFWDNKSKRIGIGGEITGSLANKTLVDGGIWLSRDSLSFDFQADRVPVGFLRPFMSAFSTGISGRATGDIKLYGKFKGIDLKGKVKADSVELRLLHTNVSYHGSDSIFFNPGEITIPAFTIYDRYGNSGIFSGQLLHKNFRNSQFNFRLTDVKNMLCFDTDPSINPVWYGTIFGSGSAGVRGWPGVVNVSVDMRTTDNSSFTFVINNSQAADDYTFLSFTDKKRTAEEKERKDSVDDIVSSFRRKVGVADADPSKFQLDLRVGVMPNTSMTLVMDPVSGDKIIAKGIGNIQVDYDSERDAMQMFGKYSLEEGTYNFSLQDLILRDFKIRQGSTISFNGNPLNALLDITAAYRVNTNLSDLDKSFSSDRELNRTNVPVDALLMVEGELQHPDITFDIELPTLTQDVERKVKSIISTDDMMNRQMIYLLALNRFYTPEYMGITSNGGELASVASTTLSSQLSNMIGQLTDKFTVAPSFRSDKGDFSDLEFDVSLSSRLLNNRLLVNGNFGYRDRTTSQTTFVGDFDIEYLLNRRGNLRLKAYNHFNDQSYYLRQALTTQGLGIIYRMEFDNPFSFLRRKKRMKESENDSPESPADPASVIEKTEK